MRRVSEAANRAAQREKAVVRAPAVAVFPMKKPLFPHENV
jgi:hypothetical protein